MASVCVQPLTDAVCPLTVDRPCRLPPIEEAWNKNTSSEMNRETQKLQPAAQAAKLAQQQQQQVSSTADTARHDTGRGGTCARKPGVGALGWDSGMGQWTLG